MMLKFGLVWMGVPVSMPVYVSTAILRLRVPPRDSFGEPTILDQLSYKHANLYRGENVDDPCDPPAEPAFLLLLLAPPSARARICLWVCIVSGWTIGVVLVAVHLGLRMHGYRVVICEGVLLVAIRCVLRRIAT